MISSARRAIACVLFIFIAAVCSESQVAPAKTATITGKVTLKTKGLAGIVVAVKDSDNSGRPDRSSYRTTTDQNGSYRITNIAPGTYQVVPLAPGLIPEEDVFQKSLVIEEGDNVEDVNFSLVRGGVITGKITDADGRPVVEEQIFFQPVDGNYAESPYYGNGIATDDRGVYRAFGLRTGKYKVYVGEGEYSPPGAARTYRQTFYPSVTDETKATVVEVTEGGEATNIDITMGRPMAAFKVTGRIVDGETGKPVPNITYGISYGAEGRGQSSSSGFRSNASGEFKFEGLMPGSYAVFIAAERNTEVWAEPVPFEVVDHDVTGLVVKTAKGSSLSGVVVMEGVEDAAAMAKLTNLYVQAIFEPRGPQNQRGSSAVVGPDGSFRIIGLSPGVIQFGVAMLNFGGKNGQVALVRVERDGMLQTSGISIKDGEQIAGVRLVIKMLTATIRGQVKIEDGELPANARFSISIHRVDEERSPYKLISTNPSPEIDSRGRFLIEGLAGGRYEISVAVIEGGRYDGSRVVTQQVTIADNSVNEVTVTMKLKP